MLGREERGGDAALVPTDGPALSFVRRDRGLRGSACWAWRGKRRERLGFAGGSKLGRGIGFEFGFWVFFLFLFLFYF